jgi:hypothetical protein
MSIKPSEKTGVEIMDAMVQAPTLDRFFDNDPKTLTDDDLWELIGAQRAQRAIFMEKESER